MQAYKGNEKYIFVSYAQRDSEQVLPMIETLQIAGFRVYYHVDAEDEVFFSVDQRLESCDVVLAFISPNTIDSVNARKEINYVMQNQKDMLVAYLEDINSQYGLGKQLNFWVSLHRAHYPTEVSFLNEILKAPMLQEYKMGGNETVSSVRVQAQAVKQIPASVQQYKVGDIIKLGSYVQDYGWEDPIEWQVLDIHNGKALVISKYGLDCKPYNETLSGVTWETCTLRKWLNNDFLNSAFSDSERAKILSVRVFADKNPKYDTNPGNATQDKIFLLSIPEAQKYFGNDEERKCKPTAFAVANGTHVNSENGNCGWWLRSLGGYYQTWTDIVCSNGYIGKYSTNVNNDSAAVRPAFWMNLES